MVFLDSVGGVFMLVLKLTQCDDNVKIENNVEFFVSNWSPQLHLIPIPVKHNKIIQRNIFFWFAHNRVIRYNEPQWERLCEIFCITKICYLIHCNNNNNQTNEERLFFSTVCLQWISYSISNWLYLGELNRFQTSKT